MIKAFLSALVAILSGLVESDPALMYNKIC